jgi:hypothetical protein
LESITEIYRQTNPQSESPPVTIAPPTASATVELPLGKAAFSMSAVPDFPEIIRSIRPDSSPQLIEMIRGNMPGRESSPDKRFSSAAQESKMFSDPRILEVLRQILEESKKPTRARMVYTEWEEMNNKVQTIRDEANFS